MYKIVVDINISMLTSKLHGVRFTVIGSSTIGSLSKQLINVIIE
jgi:hypothetical protein